MNLQNNGFINELKKNRVMYFMLLPTLLFFIINSYLPMVGIYYAFTRFEFDKGLFGSSFIGLDNFAFLWKSNLLWKITANTIGYNLAFILIGNALQILMAILLSQITHKIFRRITQSVMFLPYFVSFVLISALTYNIFNYETGAFNVLLKSFHLQPFDFYNSPGVWPFLIIIAYLWKYLGYGTVIYLATIMSINDEYYEAAEIDGANIFQQICHITIPHLIPTAIILFLLSLGNIMKGQFDLFYNMVGANGVLFDVTDIIDTYVFRSLMVNVDIGMGSAAGLYQSVFGFMIIMIVNGLIKRNHEEYALF